MAVWEVRAVMQYGDRFWENVWDIDIGTATDVPPALILAIEAFHLNTLLNLYSLARIVRRPKGTTDEFVEIVVAAAGLIDVGAAHALPLWNSVRLILGVAAGRVGFKFLRGLLTDAMIADEQNHITSGIISAVETRAITLFNAASDAACFFVVGADDKPSVSPTVQATIQMRQQHRKRKKPA